MYMRSHNSSSIDQSSIANRRSPATSNGKIWIPGLMPVGKIVSGNVVSDPISPSSLFVNENKGIANIAEPFAAVSEALDSRF